MQSVGFAETLELDLDDAVQRALTTNPAIKIAVSEKKGSRAELNAARAGRGISIDAEHRSGRGGYADPQWNTATRSYSKILVILTVILLPLRFPFILVDNYQER